MRCLRTTQMHLTGHMWSAGSVFETPALKVCYTSARIVSIVFLCIDIDNKRVQTCFNIWDKDFPSQSKFTDFSDENELRKDRLTERLRLWISSTAHVIRGLFICEFAYSHLKNDPKWQFSSQKMDLLFANSRFVVHNDGTYLPRITRETCILSFEQTHQ